MNKNRQHANEQILFQAKSRQVLLLMLGWSAPGTLLLLFCVELLNSGGIEQLSITLFFISWGAIMFAIGRVYYSVQQQVVLLVDDSVVLVQNSDSEKVFDLNDLIVTGYDMTTQKRIARLILTDSAGGEAVIEPSILGSQKMLRGFFARKKLLNVPLGVP